MTGTKNGRKHNGTIGVLPGLFIAVVFAVLTFSACTETQVVTTPEPEEPIIIHS